MNHTHNRWLRLALIGAVLVAAVFSLALRTGHSAQAQTGGTLGYGSKVYGTISETAPLVTYSFSGNPGDFVAVTADTWTGTLDLRIDLVAPNGLVLDQSAQNTPSGDAVGAYLSVFLPDPGVYLLRLSGENGTTGDYLLTLAGRSAATATPLAYGQAVDVTIPQNASPQFFAFETEDCPTTLIVSDPSQGQPFAFPFVAKVRDQRGHTVALLRGGEQMEDWVTVQPNSGRYEVEVLAADPSLTGSIRLLVTCSGDNPGCPAGQAALGGLTGECTPCPGPGDLVPGGGCPDLNFTAQQGLHMLTATTVSWDPMPGADGYTVRVTGITTEGGEVYLTHADWVPGNPTEFTWILPVAGYSGYRFTLEVLAEGSVICTQQVQIPVEETSADCPDLGLSGVVTDMSVNAVALSWAAALGADQFDLDLYSLIDGGEEYSGRLVLPGDATGRTFDHFPPHLDGVRFVLWMWQEGRLCSAELTIPFAGRQYVCPALGLAISGHDPATHAVTLSWFGLEEIEGYEVDVYGIDAGGVETVVDRLTGLPAGATSTSYVYPDGYAGFRFVLRIVGGPIECSGEITMLQQQVPCSDFSLSVAASTGTRVDLVWSAYPGADGYVYLLMDAARNPVPGHSVVLGPTQLNLVLESPPLAPGTYIASVGPWDDVDGGFCAREVTIAFGSPNDLPCAIRTDRRDVPVHVGPGPERSVFTYLPPGEDILVIGQALGSDGNLWWEINKAQIPGGDAAASLWVAQSDVTTVGNCTQIPEVEIPPVIPEEPGQPSEGWGPCGSCDSCGHPASECVTSPEGLCLWDPATCLAGPPPEGSGDCFGLSTAVDPGSWAGSVSVLTGSNCDGGYAPGTVVQVSASASDPKMHFDHWSGCGAGGSSNPVSITMTGSCTITAHFTG